MKKVIEIAAECESNWGSNGQVDWNEAEDLVSECRQQKEASKQNKAISQALAAICDQAAAKEWDVCEVGNWPLMILKAAEKDGLISKIDDASVLAQAGYQFAQQSKKIIVPIGDVYGVVDEIVLTVEAASHGVFITAEGYGNRYGSCTLAGFQNRSGILYLVGFTDMSKDEPTINCSFADARLPAVEYMGPEAKTLSLECWGINVRMDGDDLLYAPMSLYEKGSPNDYWTDLDFIYVNERDPELIAQGIKEIEDFFGLIIAKESTFGRDYSFTRK